MASLLGSFMDHLQALQGSLHPLPLARSPPSAPEALAGVSREPDVPWGLQRCGDLSSVPMSEQLETQELGDPDGGCRKAWGKKLELEKMARGGRPRGEWKGVGRGGQRQVQVWETEKHPQGTLLGSLRVILHKPQGLYPLCPPTPTFSQARLAVRKDIFGPLTLLFSNFTTQAFWSGY